MADKTFTPPEEVSFDGLNVPLAELTEGKSRKFRPTPASWQRVQFPLPEAYNAPKAVDEWLEANCPNDWVSYHYNNPKSKTYGDRLMVVRFENKDDAILFKLRGGHQAWEL